MKIVEVIWTDSNLARGWTSHTETRKYLDHQSFVCKSVGYLVEETEEKIALLMSQSWQYIEDEESSSGAELLTIPRKAVKDVRELE